MTLKELRQTMREEQLVNIEVIHKVYESERGSVLRHGCFLMKNEPISNLSEKCFCNEFKVLWTGTYDSPVITIEVLE